MALHGTMKHALQTASAAVLALGLAAGLFGCKPDAAVRKGEPVNPGMGASKAAQAPSAPMPDSATLGTLVGSVTYSGQPPARVPIDMSQDPACGLSGGQNLSEQYVVGKGGGLANVYVYLKDAKNYGAVDTTPVVIDQKGCRFVPHVAAIQAGGTVEFRNSDPTMHNVHAVTVGGKSLDVSQGPGAKPQDVTFDKPATMLPIRCNNHPWMEAMLNVAPNRFFAVTDADGQFRITGVPAGTYTLAFVHEKLGEEDVKVTVSAMSTTPVLHTFHGEK